MLEISQIVEYLWKVNILKNTRQSKKYELKKLFSEEILFWCIVIRLLYPLDQQRQQQLYFFVQKYKNWMVSPQIAGKLVVAGQDKYMNNTNYVIETKTLSY